MNSEWSMYRLADLISIKHGFAFKGEHFTDSQTPYQLTTPGNFAVGGGFQPGKGKFYSGPIPSDYILRTGDVIVTMTDLSKAADTLGYAAFVPQTPGTTWLHNQRVGLVRLKPNVPLLPEYLQYMMRSEQYRHWIVASATGSTVKHTSPSRICEFECTLPPLSEQEGVAALLMALDHRIALLSDTNATLEAIAQALFKSWFVDFDPVRAKLEGRTLEAMDEATAALFPAGFDEAERCFMPRGWKSGTLSDVAANKRTNVQPGAMSADHLYVGLEHIPRQSLALDTWNTAEDLASAKSCFVKGNILFGRLRPYFHKVVIAPFTGVCSTDILVCNALSPHYHCFAALHLFSNELVAYADRLSNGAKMPRVSWKDLAAYEILIPPDSLAAAFDEKVMPMFEKIIANVLEAKTLMGLRDTLLPRLISGQLRLSNVEQFSEVMTGT